VASNPLFLRALIAFLALPGVVAFAVPLLLLRPDGMGWTLSAPGPILATVGAVLLAWCVREFYVAGSGTLAPWAPPKHLVVSGPYRYSRNPMYVAVLCIVAGWAAGFRSTAIGLYACGLFIAFHLRILLHEEPFLGRAHGEGWRAYAASVPRWFAFTRPSAGKNDGS
jgi:protein-S-isoprenylcysteine O-methyltransferase Ste14